MFVYKKMRKPPQMVLTILLRRRNIMDSRVLERINDGSATIDRGS